MCPPSCVALLPHLLQAPHPNVTQEEDFITHTFGLPLNQAPPSKQDKSPEAKPFAAISLAEDQLMAARQQSHQQAESSSSPDVEAKTAALLTRLRFSKNLLQVQLVSALCASPFSTQCRYRFMACRVALCCRCIQA